MAWWDSEHRATGASLRLKSRLALGDAFPRLGSASTDRQTNLERESASLPPACEELPEPPTAPALVVRVEIRFTDPIIRSGYCRSYGSSPAFQATNRICRGIVRRIERCSEELLTRKDSGALDIFQADTYDRKPQRFEMTFRIIRRDKGEWAERTYRSYQKLPLTVAFANEIILSTHRMIGLFLRRYDEHFQWLDCPVPDGDPAESETVVPLRDGPLTLLCVPRSRFVEATQSFEFVPGYNIELRFRRSSSRRHTLVFEKMIRVNSRQTAPLTLAMSEDMLSTALHVISRALDAKRQELDDRADSALEVDVLPSDDDALEADVRISNNLGPVFNHVHRYIRSKLPLFWEPDARACDGLLRDVERSMARVRNEADSKLNTMNDFEIRIVELKGMGWTLREPAKFTLAPLTSYGRRTIQAALERIQTGIGDVIRGHNIAIHVTAHKRGHLVLDKAIVAHEKRGNPSELFPSRAAAQVAFVSRLKSRIQMDMDRVFEDSCSINDIPEDEDEYFARPITPAQAEQAVFDAHPFPQSSPLSTRSSPAQQSAAAGGNASMSSRPRAQRVFSLSRQSTESVRSVDYLAVTRNSFASGTSTPVTATSEQEPEQQKRGLSAVEGQLLAAAEVKPAQRSFPLVTSRSSSAVRVSSASTLIEEPTMRCSGADGQHTAVTQDVRRANFEACSYAPLTSGGKVVSFAVTATGKLPALDSPAPNSPATEAVEVPPQSRESKFASPAPSELRQSDMDIPEAFVDAREYAASPVSMDNAKAESSEALLSTTTSPREEDEFSTAPSTPDLSTGASSPSRSVLITPTYLRADATPENPDLGFHYPVAESGPSDGTGLKRGDDVEHTCKGYRQRSAHADFCSGLSNLGTAQAFELPKHSTEGKANTAGDAKQRSAEGTPDPAVRVVSRHEVHSDAQDMLTPSEPVTLSPSPQFHSDAILGNQVNLEPLGADDTAVSDHHAPAPDFPTRQVRRSDPSKGTDDASVLHEPVPGFTFGSVNGLKSPLESKLPADEAAGSELGAGAGAEVKNKEDSLGRTHQHDASELSFCVDPNQDRAARPEAVLSGPKITDENPQSTELGTEGLVLNDSQAKPDIEQCPSRKTEPAAGDTDGHVRGYGAGDGAELTADGEHGEKFAAEHAPPVDVGLTEEVNAARDGDELGVFLPDTAEGLPDKSCTTGSDATNIHIHPENEIVSQTLETPGLDVAAGKTGVPDEGSHSVPPVVLQPSVADPETGVVGRTPEPTKPGAEESVGSHAESDAVSDGAELRVCVAKVEAEEARQDILLGVPGTASGLVNGELLDDQEIQEEPATTRVKAKTEAAGLDRPVHGTPEEAAVIESSREDDISAEDAKPELDDGVENKPIPAATVAPSSTDTKGPEQTLLEQAECLGDDSVATPGLIVPEDGASSISETVLGEARARDDAEERDLLEAGAGEKQAEASIGLAQGLAGDAVETRLKGSEAAKVDKELLGLTAQANGIGPDDAYEPRQAQAHPDDECFEGGKPFGAEAEVSRLDGALEEESIEPEKGDVCPQLEKPPVSQLGDKHIAPTVSAQLLTAAEPGTPTPLAGAESDDLSTGIEPPSTHPTTETPPLPETAQAPPSLPTQSRSFQPPLAPIPDVAKLFPTPTRTYNSTDDAFATTRKAVNTFLTLTVEDRTACPPAPVAPPFTSPHPNQLQTARTLAPATAGYLGLGLCGLGLANVGHRGAVGDVCTGRRWVSPPLVRRVLHRDLQEGRPLPPDASASFASGGNGMASSGLDLRNHQRVQKNNGDVGAVDGDGAADVGGRDGDVGGDRDEVSVMPRMMMLLAGAVVAGKLLRGAAE